MLLFRSVHESFTTHTTNEPSDLQCEACDECVTRDYEDCEELCEGCDVEKVKHMKMYVKL